MACTTPTGTWVASGSSEHPAQRHRWHYPEIPTERLREFWCPKATTLEAERDLLCAPGCYHEGMCPPSRAFPATYVPERLPVRSARELLGDRIYSFVGDSIIRQQFLSLACQLRRHVDVAAVRPEHRYWRTGNHHRFTSLPLLPRRNGGGASKADSPVVPAGKARLQAQYLTGFFEGNRAKPLPIDPRIFEVRPHMSARDTSAESLAWL